MTLTDYELFKNCRNGDALAWESFVRRHQQRIFNLAGAYTRNYEDTRDLAQEIFIKIFRNLDKCRSAEMVKPWMMAVGRNTAIDYLRRLYRQPSTVSNDVILDLAPSSIRTPEQICEIQSQRDLLRRGLTLISTRFREIIMLKDIQEMSLQDISRILDIPEGTVKSRLHNARIALSRTVMDLCRSEVCNVSL